MRTRAEGETSYPISRGFVLQNYHPVVLFFFTPPLLLLFVPARSSSLLERAGTANERLISRVKLLAFTAAISTNTLVRAYDCTRPTENGISFPLRSSRFPILSIGHGRSYFRHDYHFYCYSPLSARKSRPAEHVVDNAVTLYLINGWCSDRYQGWIFVRETNSAHKTIRYGKEVKKRNHKKWLR